MAEGKIISVPKEMVDKFERRNTWFKWMKQAAEIHDKLKSGEKVVGYYIGLPNDEDRPEEVTSIQGSLAQRVRAAFHKEQPIFTTTRYNPGENEMLKGWWLLFSFDRSNFSGE